MAVYDLLDSFRELTEISIEGASVFLHSKEMALEVNIEGNVGCKIIKIIVKRKLRHIIQSKIFENLPIIITIIPVCFEVSDKILFFVIETTDISKDDFQAHKKKRRFNFFILLI